MIDDTSAQAQANSDADFAHAVRGRDDIRLVAGGIAAGMAILFLVMAFAPPLVPPQHIDAKIAQSAAR